MEIGHGEARRERRDEIITTQWFEVYPVEKAEIEAIYLHSISQQHNITQLPGVAHMRRQIQPTVCIVNDLVCFPLALRCWSGLLHCSGYVLNILFMISSSFLTHYLVVSYVSDAF